MTLARINQKERLREILLERQGIEEMKLRERKELKRADQREALLKEKRVKQKMKEKVFRKINQLDTTKREISNSLKMMQ